jgi:hypothetical protein
MKDDKEGLRSTLHKTLLQEDGQPNRELCVDFFNPGAKKQPGWLYGYGALHLAIVNNRENAANVLLDFIASACSTTPELQRALANTLTHKHASKPDGKKANDLSHRSATALHLGAALGCKSLVQRMIQCTGIFDANIFNYENRAVVTIAIMDKDTDLVRELLRRTNCNPEMASADPLPMGALTWALPLHNHEVSRLLCVKGTKVKQETLMYAFTRYKG